MTKSELVTQYAEKIRPLLPLAKKAYGSRTQVTPAHKASQEYTTVELLSQVAQGLLLLSATPEQLAELKKLDTDFEIKMKELEVDLYALETKDIQDARNRFSKDWTSRVIGVTVVGGFMGYIFLVTLQPPEQNSEALINLVLGYLGGLASAVISFYFGASNTPDKDV